jgi:hypothetical protein
MPLRLVSALASYGLLAAMAALTLEGKLRVFTLIFLAGLAVKTIIGWKTRS